MVETPDGAILLWFVNDAVSHGPGSRLTLPAQSVDLLLSLYFPRVYKSSRGR